MIAFAAGLICGAVIGAVLMFVILGGDDDDFD